MGKLNLGILGGFSGTVGTVVGTTNKKGDDIIRAKSKKSRPASSADQLKQQSKFGLTTGFFKVLNEVIKFGLKQKAETEQLSPFNYACKQALKNAVKGTDENPAIDYSAIVISDGPLSRISGATAELTDGVMNFSWSDNLETYVGKLTDQACLLVYNVSKGEISFSNGVVTRAAKSATVPLPYSSSGDILVCYMFFRSATNPLEVSTNQYLGTFEAA